MPHFTRRDFLQASLIAGATAALPLRSAHAANSDIGVGMIGCGGRAGELSGGFNNIEGAKVVACTDPDAKRSGQMAEKFGAKSYSDMRKLLEDSSVDVVVIATCNHWHCLAAIWAMEAGKDVYVEKPLSHSQWEGRQVVSAARKYNKIVQLGTQQRSDPMQAEIKKFLHEDKTLGEIQYVQANRLGPRGSIGKRSTPLEIPKEVDYDLWLGPAQDEPIYRNNLHYDWHWNWNTGSGEMGNWGVHILDDVRNVVYQDSVTTPKRIMALGGRVAWDDAGETPNVHYAYFDTGGIPTLIALSNLLSGPDVKKGSWKTMAGRKVGGPSSGYVVVCEGGYYAGQRGSGAAYDKDGKQIKSFKGKDINALHKANFLQAVRSRDSSSLNAEIEVGHDSSGWCNLANIAFRAAESQSSGDIDSINKDFEPWDLLVGEMQSQLKPFGITLNSQDIHKSPVLEHDPVEEQFTGEHAALGNQFLKREYRKGYEVPDFS